MNVLKSVNECAWLIERGHDRRFGDAKCVNIYSGTVMCVCVCVSMCVCVRVYVCVCERVYTYICKYVHNYIYT